MKQIPLSQGKVALVDDEDFERVNQFKWCASYNRSTNSFYAIRFVCEGGSQKRISMHRFIMDTPKDLICDHINHDTLDDRKQNLRNCTKQQNNMNVSIRKKNKIGHKNITLRPDNNKYRVSIISGSKRVFHGQYTSIEDAIQARDEALKKYHGEYANTGE